MAEHVDVYTKLVGARQAASGAQDVAKGFDHLGDEAEQAGKQSKRGAAGVDRFGRAAKRSDRDARRAGRGYVYARKGIGGLHAGVTGLTGALGFGAGLGLIGAFKVMIDEGRGAQIEQRRLTAVLKSTHGAAKVTSAQVNAYADSLSNMSGIDNDLIKSGSNLLLTFTQIRNEQGKGNKIFKRANAEMVDFAARFTHGDMQQAAKMLGRALNDPTKGVTALSRAGVSFTSQETDQIKALVKHNKLLQAQKEILNKVLPQVKGQAAASTNPVQKLQTALKNVAETLGLKLLPYIDKGAHALEKWVRQVAAGTGQGGRFRDQVVRIWNAVKPVVFWFGRAAANVFKFASAHPGLVKVAAALLLASKALKLMRFGQAIAGARTLWTWLGRAETRVETMPARLSAKRGAFAAAGTVLGGVFAAHYIAQLTGIEDADPLLFLNPPNAGDPTPGHGDVVPSRHSHGRVTGHFTRGGIRYEHRADGTNFPVANVDTTHRGTHGGRDVNTRRRGVNRTPKVAAGGDTVIHNHFYVDGKEYANVVTRHVNNDRNRR